MLLKAKIHIQGVFLATLSCTGLMMTGCGFNGTESYPDQADDKVLTNNAELGMIDINVSDELDTFHTHKRISNYTSKLAFELLKNLRGTVLDTPIAVSSFVDFDSGAQNSSKLGVLISENLLSQLQNQSIPVVDVHLMDALQINKKGNFAFNRDMDGYFDSESVKYVLAGYMTQHIHGVAINARIIQFDTKQIVSSATTLIPHYVADLYN
jgi:TolB-like protein